MIRASINNRVPWNRVHGNRGKTQRSRRHWRYRNSPVMRDTHGGIMENASRRYSLSKDNLSTWPMSIRQSPPLPTIPCGRRRKGPARVTKTITINQIIQKPNSNRITETIPLTMKRTNPDYRRARLDTASYGKMKMISSCETTCTLIKLHTIIPCPLLNPRPIKGKKRVW